MKNGRYSDAQIMAVLKQAEGGVPVSVDVSRFSAAPSARLGHLPFECDRTFPAQC